MRRILVLVLCAACGGSETLTTPVAVRTPGARATETVDVSWLGGRALVEVMVRPHRWPEVRDAARTLVGDARIPNDLERLLSAPTFDEALALVFRGGRIGSGLPGIDLDRPVLARLFEPAAPVSFAQVMEVARGESSDPLVHHWVFLPATDSDALTRALVDRLSERCEPNGPHMRCNEHTVAVLPVDDWVVVAIDTDAPPERGSQGEMGWALGHPAAAHVRFSTMQEIGPTIGARRVANALRSVDPSYREDMMSVATAELLTAHLHLQPWMEELDSVTIAVTTDPFGFVGTARQTTKGAALPLRRGSATPSSHAPLIVRTGFDMEAARAASPTVDTLAHYDEPRDVMHALQGCGTFCFQHSFSMPFSMARILRETGIVSATEDIAFVVDESLGGEEVVMQAQVDQLPGLREIGTITPRAELRARRDGAYWVGALGFPETPSIEGLATPNAPIAPRVETDAEETRCVVRMTLDAIAGLNAITRVEPAQRQQIVSELTNLRDALGSRCGNGEQATSQREAVRAALTSNLIRRSAP